MLTTEGNEVPDGRIIAAFDITAEELAALREPQCVD